MRDHMKNIKSVFISIAILVFGSIDSASGQQTNKLDCYCKGFKLHGRVQIVESFPDIKVQLVNSFPDLKVRLVDNNPSNCGEWKMVDKFPDLKIQIVNSFPDIKVQYVKSFPGMTKPK